VGELQAMANRAANSERARVVALGPAL